jgi:hypothetical protein
MHWLSDGDRERMSNKEVALDRQAAAESTVNNKVDEQQ